MLWILVPAAATFGAVAGAVMRIVLGRLARGTRIRPPFCEVAVALLWAMAALGRTLAWVPAEWVPVLFGLAWLGVAVTVVDVRHHRIPDALTLPALPVAVVCVFPLGGGAVLRAVVGAVLAVAVHAAVRVVSPRSMGSGDIKLAAPLGAVLAAAGWLALPLAAVLAAVLTAVLGTADILHRRTPGGAVTGNVAAGAAGLGAELAGEWSTAGSGRGTSSLDGLCAEASSTGSAGVATATSSGDAAEARSVTTRAPARHELHPFGGERFGARRLGPVPGRASPVPHGPSMVLAAVLVTAYFAIAGGASAPGAGPGPGCGVPGCPEAGVATAGRA